MVYSPQNASRCDSMNHKDTKLDAENKFHWLVLPGPRRSNAVYDTVVDETDNFVVLPTKGSIVPGWLLIVPKMPVTRIADLPEKTQDELEALLDRVSSRLRLHFDEPYVFEHGGFSGSQVSCGVDQAHLHVVALGFDLVEAVEEYSPNGWISTDHSTIPSREIGNEEYWFVSSRTVSKYKKVDTPCSQLFRKIIAKATGVPEFWNYKSKDFTSNVIETITAMSANG